MNEINQINEKLEMMRTTINEILNELNCLLIEQNMPTVNRIDHEWVRSD